MTAHRFLFYVPAAEEGAPSLVLDGDEHHHLRRVLRARPGDVVFATNGRGWLAECRVASVDGSSARLDVTATVERAGARRQLVLALALLRRDRFAEALEHCVELGITGCIPLVADATRVRGYPRPFRERLERVTVAAMKQSFRATRPALADPATLPAVIDGWRGRIVVGEAGADPLPRVGADEDVLVVVGPEAGLSAAERDLLAGRGAAFAAIGAYRLRSETAAVALVAAVQLRD